MTIKTNDKGTVTVKLKDGTRGVWNGRKIVWFKPRKRGKPEVVNTPFSILKQWENNDVG